MSTATNILKASLETSAFVVNAYLEDLSDDDLFIRPTENANHIAWQLGHLITAENGMINQVCSGSMPALPEGFAEQYSQETSGSDDREKFHTKADYLRLMAEQRAASLAALEQVSDEDLEKPAPEEMREYVPTVGATFALLATHALMHSGQWVIVRRKLGRGRMF